MPCSRRNGPGQRVIQKDGTSTVRHSSPRQGSSQSRFHCLTAGPLICLRSRRRVEPHPSCSEVIRIELWYLNSDEKARAKGISRCGAISSRSCILYMSEMLDHCAHAHYCIHLYSARARVYVVSQADRYRCRQPSFASSLELRQRDSEVSVSDSDGLEDKLDRHQSTRTLYQAIKNPTASSLALPCSARGRPTLTMQLKHSVPLPILDDQHIIILCFISPSYNHHPRMQGQGHHAQSRSWPHLSSK